MCPRCGSPQAPLDDQTVGRPMGGAVAQRPNCQQSGVWEADRIPVRPGTDPTPRPSRWTRAFGVGLALFTIVAAGAVGGYVLLNRDSDPGSSGSSTSVSSASAAPDQSNKDAAAAASAIARLPKDPASVLAGAAKQLVPDPRAAFPSGTSVTAQPASWAPDGTGTGGTMMLEVTYPGKGATTYIAVMVKEGNDWKVLATMEMPR